MFIIFPTLSKTIYGIDCKYSQQEIMVKKHETKHTTSKTLTTFEKRESSIDQLHLHTVKCFSSRWNVQHVEDNRLVSTKHDSPCNHRDKSVSDLSCTITIISYYSREDSLKYKLYPLMKKTISKSQLTSIYENNHSKI